MPGICLAPRWLAGDGAPAKFAYWTAFLANGEFVVPQTGWYRILAWGASGSGGEGGPRGTTTTTSSSGGSGGGSGGLAVSVVRLEAGARYPVTVGSAKTAFGSTGGEIFLEAFPGGNGGTPATYDAVVSGGAGGSARGGNLANLNGFPGGAGGGGQTYSSGITRESQPGQPGENGGAAGGSTGPVGANSWNAAGGGGGGGARLPGAEYGYVAEDMRATQSGGNGVNAANGTAGSSVPALQAGSGLKLYGGGSGGGGAGPIYYKSGAGGTGQGGAVIIEWGI